MRERLAALGGAPRSGRIDDFGLDHDALVTARESLDFLFDRYWRVELRHADRIPERGPCLFVANRSGLLPYDAFVIAEAVARARPTWPWPRPLLADPLARRPFLQPALARLGGVIDGGENAGRLLSSGRSAIAFPEGADAAARPWRDRYRMRRFARVATLEKAAAIGVPVVPVAIVGAESAQPLLGRADFWWTRRLGLDFLPITPTFPWLGAFGLVPWPSRWRVAFGRAIAPDALPGADAEEIDRARHYEALRRTIQEAVDELRASSSSSEQS